MNINKSAFLKVLDILEQNRLETEKKIYANKREINRLSDEQRLLKKVRKELTVAIYDMTHKPIKAVDLFAEQAQQAKRHADRVHAIVQTLKAEQNKPK